MTNEIANTKPKFSVVIHSDGIKNLINKTLGDEKKAQRFVASICSAVATNPQLQECDPQTVISSALLGESLNLSPSPQLGQYYLIPYKNTKKGTTDAQFQMGAKGYKQLAIRSGQYKDLDFIEVREGEYLGRDEETGKQKFKFISNDAERENRPIVGYLAYFELLNGYRKQIYWSKEKMLNHADKYSKAFNKKDYEKVIAGLIPEKDMWKYSSYWYADFDGMAEKTLYRQLISKHGVMSIDMQEAYVKDMAVLHENGDYEYVDNDNSETTPIVEEAKVEEKAEPKVKKLDDVE